MSALFELFVQDAFHWLGKNTRGTPSPLKVTPFPGELTIKARGLGATHVVVPQALGELQRLVPPLVKPGVSQNESILQWARSLGGVRANDTVISFQVRAGVPETIVLTGVRVELLSRSTPLRGTYIEPNGAGDLFYRVLTADLDQPTPSVTPSPTGEAGAWNFPLQVSQQADTEVITLICTTDLYYVEFRVLLDYVYQGEARTYMVDDGGDPFRMSSNRLAAEFAMFGLDDRGEVYRLMPRPVRR